jgi:hypothetical protein
MEVPPNIEVNQIISTFSTLSSYQYNATLLKDDSSLLPFPRWWQIACKYGLHDPANDRKHITPNRSP